MLLSHIKHLFVDDLHYFNPLQLLLVANIIKNQSYGSLVLAGDPLQSILPQPSPFADIAAILHYHEVITFHENYRSVRSIVDASSNLLSKNKVNPPTVTCINPSHDLGVRELAFETVEDERQGIQLLLRGLLKNDAITVGVVCPNQMTAKEMHQYLKLTDISTPIHSHEEIRFLMSFIRAAIDPMDTIALYDALHSTQFGVPTSEVADIVLDSIRSQKPLWEVMDAHFKVVVTSPPTEMTHLYLGVNPFLQPINDRAVKVQKSE